MAIFGYFLGGWSKTLFWAIWRVSWRRERASWITHHVSRLGRLEASFRRVGSGDCDPSSGQYEPESGHELLKVQFAHAVAGIAFLWGKSSFI